MVERLSRNTNPNFVCSNLYEYRHFYSMLAPKGACALLSLRRIALDQYCRCFYLLMSNKMFLVTEDLVRTTHKISSKSMYKVS